jgi:spore coat protein SA
MGGSVEICIYQIARRLAARHHVTIVSRKHRRYSNRQNSGNLNIVRVPSGSPSQYIRAAVNAVRGKTFDIIQIDNRPRFVPVVRNAFPHTPISLYMHSLTFVSSNLISRESARDCMSHADLIVTNSDSTADRLRQMFPTLKGKLRKVWLGVDTERFHPATDEQRKRAKSRYRIGSGFTILFTGRIIPRKGISQLMKAIRRLRKQKQAPSANLVVAGHGKLGYIRSLKAQAKKLKVPTRFLGLVSHNRIHTVYRMADCFACPSQKHESFGLVNVEAMASGLPVVASSNGGIKEIIRHGKNGLLVADYRSPQAFAIQLAKVATNRKLAAQLSKKARHDAVERFGWGTTVKKLAALYEGAKRGS